jgi:hypothetical protein
MSQDSAVCTRYGLDVSGIESQWGDEIFYTRLDRPWGSPSPYTMGNVAFPGAKRLERGVTTHSHLSPRLKKD